MKIISQYLLEVLMIAIIAYFTSNAVANQLASGLLQQNVSANEAQPDQDIQAEIKDGYGSDIIVAVKDDNTA